MALIAKSGTPSLSSVTPQQANAISSGILAGEDIAAGDACYINSDGEAMRSNGTSANAAAEADGIAARAAKDGEAVSLYRYVELHYGSGLTPGAPLYVGATAGRLDDGATTGGISPVAKVCHDGARIFFFGSNYQPVAEV